MVISRCNLLNAGSNFKIKIVFIKATSFVLCHLFIDYFKMIRYFPCLLIFKGEVRRINLMSFTIMSLSEVNHINRGLGASDLEDR